MPALDNPTGRSKRKVKARPDAVVKHAQQHILVVTLPWEDTVDCERKKCLEVLDW